MMICHSESQLERKLFERVKKMGGMCLKFVSPGRAGVPDRIILMPCGKIYFVEMKSPSGEVNPIQEYVFEKFKNLGFEVKILNSDEKIKNFLQEIYNDQLQRNFSLKNFCRNRRKLKSEPKKLKMLN